MFDKILIANRGEIARRVIRSAKALGVRTVAVYSDADRDAPFVREADEAVHIGPPAPAESYLVAERVLEAAKATGAQAIHPGYGFLSENADFAERCAQEGLVFIGPPPAAIRAMGDKSASKRLMREAGVPLAPGYEGEEQETAFLASKAEEIGYPVMIKASAGGGGKGMRIVRDPVEFEAALASCQRESQAAFGDARVLIERFVEKPRHVEIQVFADSHGNTVHLFQRDCSAQRRHQKVIEEAPAPGLSEATREAMHQAAIAAAEAVGYVGAGTVEFLLDASGEFFFMEMNTRLQVEHPVTEMITGLDLVEWQLRVAAGEPLPARQEEITALGHAFEVRIYAEDTDKGFLPATGPLKHLAFPAASDHIRIDTGVEQGGEVTPHYDPMIAKLIVWDESREAALSRLSLALAETRITGLTTNVAFLARLAALPDFRAARLDTGLIERESEALIPAPQAAPHEVVALAALAELLTPATRSTSSGDPFSPWNAEDGWRIGGWAHRKLAFDDGLSERFVNADYGEQAFSLEVDGEAFSVSGELSGGPLNEGHLTATIDNRRLNAHIIRDGVERHLFLDGRHWQLTLHDPLLAAEALEEDTGGLRAPMPGKVVKLFAEAGAAVERGAPLMVLEAMKMEHTIIAPAKGVVAAFLAGEGDQVDEGEPLVEFEAEE